MQVYFPKVGFWPTPLKQLVQGEAARGGSQSSRGGTECFADNYKAYYSSRRVDGQRIGTFQADVIFADHKIRKAKLFAGRDGHVGITRGHLTSSGSITKARTLINHEVQSVLFLIY